eukprot:7146178-Prymnesium_polylepis.1
MPAPQSAPPMTTPAFAAPHAPASRAPRTRPAGTAAPPRPAAAQTDCRGPARRAARPHHKLCAPLTSQLERAPLRPTLL